MAMEGVKSFIEVIKSTKDKIYVTTKLGRRIGEPII